MIFVDRRRVSVPESLSSARAQSVRKQLTKLLATASKRHLKQLRVSFEPDIWRQTRAELAALFHGKCAYCESPGTTSPLDVEHFRPKQGARSEDAESTQDHLYYSWLAYDWDNLLLVCMECNFRRNVGKQRYGKGALFPLDGARAPFLASVEECRRVEKPLFLDPCHDDPAQHLTFLESGLAQARTPRGHFTIASLGLNVRTTLVEMRYSAWQYVALLAQRARRAARDNDLTALERVVRDLRASLEESEQPHLAARRAAFDHYRSEILAAVGGRAAEILSVLPRELAILPRAAVSAARPPSKRSAKRTGASKEALPPLAKDRITRIEIRNFRAIAELDLEIPDSPPGEEGVPGALMMLGENAAGKSTVLEAVALTLLGTKQIRRLGIKGQERLHRLDGKRSGPPAQVRVWLGDTPIILAIDRKGRISGNAERAVVLLGYGPRRFFAPGSSKQRAPAPFNLVKSMFDPLATISDPEQWLLKCSEDEFAMTVRVLRTLLLLSNESRVTRTRTQIFVWVDGRKEALSDLSEGYKAVLALGVDIVRELLRYFASAENANAIVLIDELDTHLHPRWKMRIARGLRQAFPEVQFLASTHDPLCLRGYHSGEVQVLRRDRQRGVERVLDLPDVRGLNVQQLLTSEFFGLWSAEDPALDASIAEYITLASMPNRTPEQEADLELKRTDAAARAVLGGSVQDRLVQQAMTEYVVKSRAAAPQEQRVIKREAIDRIVSLWREVDAERHRRSS